MPTEPRRMFTRRPVRCAAGRGVETVRGRLVRFGRAVTAHALTVLALTGCRLQDALRPKGVNGPQPAVASPATDSSHVVTLATTGRVFGGAAAARDSAGTGLRQVLLGHVWFASAHDATLTLLATADTAVVAAVGSLGVTILLNDRSVARTTVAELVARPLPVPVHSGDRAVSVLLDRSLMTVPQRALAGAF